MTLFSWQRMWAILRKEFFQMKRDPVSVGMMLIIPIIQLILFVITIPSDFTSRFLRGHDPQILVEADATDSVAVASALNTLPQLSAHVFDRLLVGSLS